jgi:DNA-directed RNA polymerase subunit beta'
VQGYVEFLKKEGDSVVPGDQLNTGSIDPKELFRLKGSRETERYIIRQIQKIYLSEGASINNKHIEIIVRQMLSKSRIIDSGDTILIKGEIVSRARLLEANQGVKKSGGAPAKIEPLLLGITRVATLTDSFLSAASFQETARALVKAAVEGRTDYLQGLKENVIIGRLIPVGGTQNNTLPHDIPSPVEAAPHVVQSEH